MQQQQQQQQPPPMMMPSFPQSNITTDQIQKYLDENKKLILAIMENQNLGKLADCAQYQALLQKNLMYLAAIADAQPQGPVMTSQMSPHPMMQPGGFYMQHPQGAAMPQQQQQQQQQQQVFTPKGPLQINSPHTLQNLHQQKMHQHHAQGGLPGTMTTTSLGVNNSRNPVHTEANRGGVDGSSLAEANVPSNVRGGSKQDGGEAARVPTPDRKRSSTNAEGSGDGKAK